MKPDPGSSSHRRILSPGYSSVRSSKPTSLKSAAGARMSSVSPFPHEAGKNYSSRRDTPRGLIASGKTARTKRALLRESSWLDAQPAWHNEPLRELTDRAGYASETPQVCVVDSPGSRHRTFSPVAKAFGGAVIGSTPSPRRCRSGESVSPV